MAGTFNHNLKLGVLERIFSKESNRKIRIPESGMKEWKILSASPAQMRTISPPV